MPIQSKGVSLKILITGGAGFIGSNIADLLLANGHGVAVIDDLSTGSRQNLPSGAVFYEADIRDKAISEIFSKEKPDILIHHAAQVSVRISTEDPVQDADINILGSINLLEAAVKQKIKKVLFASSGGTVYGEQKYFPADEAHPNVPISPYGAAKFSVEKYIYYYHLQYGLPYVNLRYANIYGPRQDPYGEAGVVAIFSQKIIQGQSPIINGDGKQTRDYVFVEDAARANLLAIESDFSGELNIGTGVEISVNALFDMLKKASKKEIEKVHGPAKKGEQRRSCLQFEKARKVLGWAPRVPIEEGLKKTYAWFLNSQC